MKTESLQPRLEWELHDPKAEIPLEKEHEEGKGGERGKDMPSPTEREYLSNTLSSFPKLVSALE